MSKPREFWITETNRPVGTMRPAHILENNAKISIQHDCSKQEAIHVIEYSELKKANDKIALLEAENNKVKSFLAAQPNMLEKIEMLLAMNEKLEAKYDKCIGALRFIASRSLLFQKRSCWDRADLKQRFISDTILAIRIAEECGETE